jgi:hypothetical protein
LPRSCRPRLQVFSCKLPLSQPTILLAQRFDLTSLPLDLKMLHVCVVDTSTSNEPVRIALGTQIRDFAYLIDYERRGFGGGH